MFEKDQGILRYCNIRNVVEFLANVIWRQFATSALEKENSRADWKKKSRTGSLFFPVRTSISLNSRPLYPVDNDNQWSRPSKAEIMMELRFRPPMGRGLEEIRN